MTRVGECAVCSRQVGATVALWAYLEPRTLTRVCERVAGLGEAVVPTPPPIRSDEVGVLTPFKMLEVGKDPRSPPGTDPAQWGTQVPQPARLKERRRAVG